jgi:hypothetical protein
MVFELTTLVVIDTDYTGSCKSSYHTITTMMAPGLSWEDNLVLLYYISSSEISSD